MFNFWSIGCVTSGWVIMEKNWTHSVDQCQLQALQISVHLIDLRRRQWHPAPALLPGKSHGRRSLVSCSPWGRKESDTTERLHFHFSLSCIGEGNGNPLQYSCLENPRDGGAWRAAVSGVAQSRTRLSSSSSRIGERHAYDQYESCEIWLAKVWIKKDEMNKEKDEIE